MSKKQLIISTIFFLLILFILWGLKELFTFQWLFTKITDTIIAETGINSWLAKAMAAFFGLLITYALFLSLSWGKNRSIKVSIGLALMVVIIIGFSFTMNEMTKDNFFNPDGTPKKCYTRLYDAKVIFVDCSWKVHEKYGTPVLPVTSDIMLQNEIQEHGIPDVQELKPNKNTRFFSFDGKPLVWYYQYPDGKIKLFDKPGHHPQLNTVLSPISPEIVELLLKLKRTGKADMIIGSEDHSLENLLEDMDSWNP